MKNTIITISSVMALSGVANAQSWVNWSNLTDTSGNLLFSSGTNSGSQLFNIGGGNFMKVDWSGNFGVNTAPAKSTLGSDEIVPSGSGTQVITFSLVSGIANWVIDTQGTSGGPMSDTDIEDYTYALRTGESLKFTSPSTINVTNNGIQKNFPIAGNGTSNVLINGNESTTAIGALVSSFLIETTSNSITQEFTSPATTINPFSIAVSPVPEPSSTALLGLGGLALLLRRKK